MCKNITPEWHEWMEVQLQNTDKQKEVFQRMLHILEDSGKCREVFHQLALVLFGQDLK